jgi:hypothetical protein
MTVPQSPSDAIVESLRFISAIEERRALLPFAGDLIALHQYAHRNLEACHAASETAVEAWRSALARRWDCEVAGRRLYKQIVRQMTDYYGEGSPQLLLVSRGGAEANSTPAELLDDLRRLHAALTVELVQIPFAAERLPQVSQAAAVLEAAIHEAQETEHRRRIAVLDSRMAREAFRRTCEESFGKLAAHYGDRFNDEFSELLNPSTA